jgi:hypothetical protein
MNRKRDPEYAVECCADRTSLPPALKLRFIHTNAEGRHTMDARTQILNILSIHVQSPCFG